MVVLQGFLLISSVYGVPRFEISLVERQVDHKVARKQHTSSGVRIPSSMIFKSYVLNKCFFLHFSYECKVQLTFVNGSPMFGIHGKLVDCHFYVRKKSKRYNSCTKSVNVTSSQKPYSDTYYSEII